jgi:hypothetical protein
MFNYGFGFSKCYFGTIDHADSMKYYKIPSDLSNSQTIYIYGFGLVEDILEQLIIRTQ